MDDPGEDGPANGSGRTGPSQSTRDGPIFVVDFVPAGVFPVDEQVTAAQREPVPGHHHGRLVRGEALVFWVVRVAQRRRPVPVKQGAGAQAGGHRLGQDDGAEGARAVLAAPDGRVAGDRPPHDVAFSDGPRCPATPALRSIRPSRWRQAPLGGHTSQ